VGPVYTQRLPVSLAINPSPGIGPGSIIEKLDVVADAIVPLI
jgi:hypothetical protein